MRLILEVWRYILFSDLREYVPAARNMAPTTRMGESLDTVLKIVNVVEGAATLSI